MYIPRTLTADTTTTTTATTITKDPGHISYTYLTHILYVSKFVAMTTRCSIRWPNPENPL